MSLSRTSDVEKALEAGLDRDNAAILPAASAGARAGLVKGAIMAVDEEWEGKKYGRVGMVSYARPANPEPLTNVQGGAARAWMGVKGERSCRRGRGGTTMVRFKVSRSAGGMSCSLTRPTPRTSEPMVARRRHAAARRRRCIVEHFNAAQGHSHLAAGQLW